VEEAGVSEYVEIVRAQSQFIQDFWLTLYALVGIALGVAVCRRASHWSGDERPEHFVLFAASTIAIMMVAWPPLCAYALWKSWREQRRVKH
jgi:hypothetical protein